MTWGDLFDRASDIYPDKIGLVDEVGRLTSLKKISVGGAPSTPELLRAAYEKLTCIVINGFGSSEGTNTATRPGDSIDIICNSVGRPACPYDTIKIIDDAGNEVPPGVEGELVSKGPGVFTGYFRSQEENKETVQQLPERIEFIECLPATKVGKVDKKVLREGIRKRLEG